MTIRQALHGDVEIAYEAIGDPEGEPLLLLMGTGGQMLSWPDGFCDLLVERGFCVARFDNRDSGLSTHLNDAGAPNQLTMLMRPAAAAVYLLEDMAGDALAVLDALGWPSAHVAGMSQGGMVAQVLAVHHPERVRSLTSISSSPAPRLGQPTPGTFPGDGPRAAPSAVAQHRRRDRGARPPDRPGRQLTPASCSRSTRLAFPS